MKEPIVLSENLTIAPQGIEVLKAYIASDVHLNDHPYDEKTETENPRRRVFREFLTKLNQDSEQWESHQLLLILNGDILDITGSWFEAILPWDDDTKKVETLTGEVIRRIALNNQSIFQEFAKLLENPHNRIIFVIGNHDGLLKRFPSTQEILRSFITSDSHQKERIQFVSHLEIPLLDLYAEHGHRFDLYNRSDEQLKHPLGDYINILLVNRFVDLVISQLNEDGYSVEVISQVRQQLHDIEYLRPFSLIPLWIENIAKQFRQNTENHGKRESIDSIILSMLAEVLDREATRRLVEQLNLPRKFLTSFVNWCVHLPGSLPIVSFAISNVMRRSHSNRYQYKMAQKLRQDKNCRFITFGHTHVPTVIPLSQEGYYFNTGSWKPVVNLFREWEYDKANLEYLTPNVRFNKIERSGILVMEKNLLDLQQPIQFALQTNESNISHHSGTSILGL